MGTNADQSRVEAALSTVTTTKQALNGDRKVTDAKNNANQTLSTLDGKQCTKGAVTGNINQAHTVAEGNASHSNSSGTKYSDG